MASGGRALVAMLVVLGLLHNAAAATYPVGSSSNGGWTYVNSGETSYDDQFSNITLFVGDILSFTFTTNAHDVVEVPPSDVAGCSSSNPIQWYNSSQEITLSTSGQHGFICSLPNHCSQDGMFLTVTVNEAAAPASAPAAEGPAPGTPVSPASAPPSASPAPAPSSPTPSSPAPSVSPASAPQSAPASAPGTVSSTPESSPEGSTPAAPGPGGNPDSSSFKLQSLPTLLVGSLLAACAMLVL